MDRLKLWLIPVYAFIGFLVVGASMPKTSWVLRVDTDTISHPYQANPARIFESTESYTAALYPLGPDPTDPARDEDTTFLRLRDWAGRDTQSGRQASAEVRARQMHELWDFCRQKNAREYWAQYARIAYLDSKIPTIPVPPTSPDYASVQNSRRLQVGACELGGKLDPTNGFFPIMEAGALYGLGDKVGAREKLEEASISSRFDEYLRFESDARNRWFVRKFGYRGHQIETMELAALLLPHLAQMKSICRKLEEDGTPTDRIAVAKLGQLLMRKATSLIGMLVGKSIVTIALSPPVGNGTLKPVPDAQVVPLIKKLQAAAPESGDLSSIAVNYKALKPPFLGLPSDGIDEFLRSDRSSFGIGSLLSVVLLPLIIIGVWFKSRNSNLNAAAPYLIWPAFLWLTLRNSADFLPLFAAASLLFLPALFERSRRMADLIGIAVSACAVAACLLTGKFEVLASAVPFAVALVMQRFWAKIPIALTAVVAALAVVALSGVIAIAITGGGFPLWMLSITCLVAAVALVPVGEEFRWEPAAGLTCLIATAVLGYAVSGQLAADRGLSKVNLIFLNEAQRMRESLGIH